jgi:CHAT domain-containing protein
VITVGGRLDGSVPEACPDAEQLAEYVDGRLSAVEREALEAHLLTCSACRAVAVESAVFVTGVAGARPRRLRFPAGRWVAAVAGGLAAATLVLAIRLAGSNGWFKPSATRPELAELIEALSHEPTRPIEGRLAGGFPYAAPPIVQRGAESEVAPSVAVAAARIRQRSGAGSPDHDAALGIAYLALHDYGRAIDVLEQAVRQRPADAEFVNDLSAAYLARAKFQARADDLPRALDMAERALASRPRFAEAQFNRALALEALHLDMEAEAAWTACQSLEGSSSRWSEEATEHARTLGRRRSSSRARDGHRNQQTREKIEDELLGRWAEAFLAGRSADERQAIDDSEQLASRLAQAGGDSMPQDEIALIRRAQGARSARALISLARGHALYAQARRDFLEERVWRAGEVMSRAAAEFRRASSPYALWGPVYRAIPMWIRGAGADALRELTVINASTLASRHFNLRGRIEWTKAMAFEVDGRYDLAALRLAAATHIYLDANETENLGANEAYLGAAQHFLGDRRQTWLTTLQALEHLGDANSRRNVSLTNAAIFSLDEELPHAALAFQDELMRSMDASGQKSGRLDMWVRRAQVLNRLGRIADAADGLVKAEREVTLIQDERLRSWSHAELDMAKAEIFQGTDTNRALESTDEALRYYRQTSAAVRVSELLVLRGKILELRGDVDGAQQAYRAAAAAFEVDRSKLTTPQLRLEAFQQERAAFRELVRFEAVVRRDFAETLRVAERERARTLIERWRGIDSTAVDPTASRGRLPSDVVVVYYVALEDRVLVWILSRKDFECFEQRMGRVELDAAVDRMYRLIADGANLADIGSGSRRLLDQLLEPAVKRAPAGSQIVFVPDGPLSSIPFGALPTATGQPLIAAHAVSVIPSLTGFFLASDRATTLGVNDVLAVGDGHDPALTGLPVLPLADDEARSIGSLYPHATVLLAGKATARQFLAAEHAVVHFAGHTIVNSEFPSFSRLLFAPDQNGHEDGSLFAGEIAERRYVRTRLVVLSTCDGAAGKLVAGEGIVSVARMFLDAGVPSVVASLWPVDDDTHGLFVQFHRHLRLGEDVAEALREAQLKILEERGGRAALRSWGGFIALGGLVASKPS